MFGDVTSYGHLICCEELDRVRNILRKEGHWKEADFLRAILGCEYYKPIDEKLGKKEKE